MLSSLRFSTDHLDPFSHSNSSSPPYPTSSFLFNLPLPTSILQIPISQSPIDVTLDPGFKSFYAFAKENNIPVIIVSSGMTPIIRSILANLIGDKDASEIDVISNEVKFTDPEQKGETWELVYRHPDK